MRSPLSSLRLAKSPCSPRAGWFASTMRCHRAIFFVEAALARMGSSPETRYLAYISFARFTSSP
eukprot:18543-Pelagococcus_subviridis.AAC.4